MKTTLKILTAVALTSSFVSVQAQPRGGPMGGPPVGAKLNARMAKFLGENKQFSANLEIQTKEMKLPGQIAFNEGTSRFEMDLTKASGGMMRPEMAEQMKMMGMDKVVRISRPDKKLEYQVYPGLESYVESPFQDETADAADKYKIETTELGRETIGGHPCVKNKVVITDEKGEKREATVWNATDLKQFPLKISHSEDGQEVTLAFSDVKLSKPDKVQFEPPTAFKRYDNQGSLVRDQMTKRFSGGAGGFAPPQR